MLEQTNLIKATMKLILSQFCFLIYSTINFHSHATNRDIDGKTLRFKGEFAMGMTPTLLRNTGNWDDSTLTNCTQGDFLSGLKINSMSDKGLPGINLILDQIQSVYRANGNRFIHLQRISIKGDRVNAAEVIIYLRHAH